MVGKQKNRPGTRPLLCFGRLWTNWTSVRQLRGGGGCEVTTDVFAVLTCESKAEVDRVRP